MSRILARKRSYTLSLAKSERRWTKEEFMERVDPCGYRVSIWFFFLLHPHGATLLDVVNARWANPIGRLWAVRQLDYTIYFNQFIRSDLFALWMRTHVNAWIRKGIARKGLTRIRIRLLREW